MIQDRSAGEQAARIVEALQVGTAEDGAAELAAIARELRDGADDWREAERTVEDRRATAAAPVAALLEEAANAIRDRAADD